jgi:hypothetical protein
MKGLHIIGCLLPLVSTAYGQSSFRPAEPHPLDKATSLECVPVKVTDRDRRDPIYKIIVTLSLDDGLTATDLTVVHYATSGTPYSRADQYTRSNLTQTPGKTEYYWTGTWIKNATVTMTGSLIRSADGKWTYSEQQYKYGRPSFFLLSVCHLTTPD